MISPHNFGSYTLIERISIGGMAEVLRAEDRERHRIVAIKRILPSVSEDEEFVQMFRDEAVIASQLDHPNIAKIFDVGKVDKSYYLAIEFVEGKDLHAILADAATRREPLPLAFVLYVMMEACKAIGYAHDAKDQRGNPFELVHRDINPQNILVSYGGQVKLIDFGIAKARGKLTRTQVGTIRGKFGYMSPEQVRGLPIDRRSDIFSLGVCFWELLTLSRLFSGESEIAVMEKIRNGEIPSIREQLPDIPSALESIVMKLLAKDVDERYAAASELHADLQSFAETESIVVNEAQAADLMHRVFASEKVVSAPERENASMSEDKGGSDLDVFEELAKKKGSGMPSSLLAGPSQTKMPQGSASNPPPPPPQSRPSSALAPPPPRRQTLVGLPSAQLGAAPSSPALPLPPLSAPPVSLSSSLSSSPPPLPGASASGAPALPARRSTLPPPPRSSRSFPAAASPSGASGTLIGSFPAPQIQLPAQPVSRAGSPTLSRPAAGPSTSTRNGNNVSVDMDWDDDEKTNVFEKQGEDAGSFPGPAAGAPPPRSVGSIATAGSALAVAGAVSRPTIPSQAPAPMPAVPALAPPPADLSKSVSGRDKGGTSRTTIFIGVGFLAAAAAVLLLKPKPGQVTIVVTGVGGKAVEQVALLVDDTKRCDTPCTVEIDKGSHRIKAMADGYATQEQESTLQSGEQVAITFRLEKPASNTGLRVTGKQPGVELWVDGKEIGPLPQELKGLAPGEHKVQFKGSERYATEEHNVTVTAGETKDLGTVSLKVLRGLASFDVKTRGAKVTLVSGNDRRQLTEFSQPVEIETSRRWSIEASKTGYQDFRQPIVFEDRAEKAFVIELVESERSTASAAPAEHATPAERPAPAAAVRPTAPPAEPVVEKTHPDTSKQAEETAGNCTLNFNSIPVSNVLLDGRPLGGTPKLAVGTSSGAHAVVFVNADYGRKALNVTCKAGETKTVATRFKD